MNATSIYLGEQLGILERRHRCPRECGHKIQTAPLVCLSAKLMLSRRRRALQDQDTLQARDQQSTVRERSELMPAALLSRQIIHRRRHEEQSPTLALMRRTRRVVHRARARLSTRRRRRLDGCATRTRRAARLPLFRAERADAVA